MLAAAVHMKDNRSMFDFVRPGRRGKFSGLLRLAMLVSLILVRPVLLLAAQPTFRFAWLSDVHVGSTTGEQDLRAAVSDINSLTGLSFVVLSGDVTEYGSREQLRLAKEILDGLK